MHQLEDEALEFRRGDNEAAVAEKGGQYQETARLDSGPVYSGGAAVVCGAACGTDSAVYGETV